MNITYQKANLTKNTCQTTIPFKNTCQTPCRQTQQAMTRHVLKLYISVKFITANIIDRTTGDLIATASSVEHCIKNSFDCGRSSNPKAAAAVGEVLAKRFRIASFSGGGKEALRAIHVDVDREIEKKGSEKSKMIWCVVNSLRSDGLNIILDDESGSGPSV